ncbi:MAG: transcriptional repressor LexA [Bdellovibrionota bacterium]
MEPLSKRQKEILDYVRWYIDSHQFAPSYREIADHFGLSSVATVAQHLNALETKGYMEKDWNGYRSIALSRRGQTVTRSGKGLVDLPLLGDVAAGKPIDAIENPKEVGVPEDLVGPGDHFVLRVRGDSMIEDAISDGDFVVVSSKEDARSGQTVVALVDGESATVKRYRPEKGGYVRLEPANSKYKPLRLPRDRVQIRGVVVGVMRKYKN